jgi:hypothetical protein
MSFLWSARKPVVAEESRVGQLTIRPKPLSGLRTTPFLDSSRVTDHSSE